MKALAPEVILLLNIVRVTGSCQEGDDYVYSATQVEAQRCSDDKFFYYTSQFLNESTCLVSETFEEGLCWWDTTVESHCLEAEECLWLEDNVAGGACYCAETDTCSNCDGQTQGPSYTVFDCPEDCKVFYVGCPSNYCNCFGECAPAEELNCSDPVDPHCYSWYTDSPSEAPTFAPTSPQSVYWGCKLCCFGESKIHSTTSSVAQALGLDDNKVKIKSYTMVSLGGRRRTEVDQQWDIVYQIGLEEEDSTGDMIDTLGNAEVLDKIGEYMSTDLDIELESIETTTLSETDPTAVRSSSPSSSMGATIGGIIGALACLLVFGYAGYRLYMFRKMRQFNIDTDRMTADGLCPVGDDDVTNL